MDGDSWRPVLVPLPTKASKHTGGARLGPPPPERLSLLTFLQPLPELLSGGRLRGILGSALVISACASCPKREDLASLWFSPAEPVWPPFCPWPLWVLWNSAHNVNCWGKAQKV